MNIDKRQEYNLKIIDKLRDYIMQHPEFRFHQVLWAAGIITRDNNMNIVDKFYEEPEETYNTLKI